MEIKNVKNGAFFLTDNEIARLENTATHLIFVDIDNGIWLLKNNSLWLKQTIKDIKDLRSYSSAHYNNLDPVDIKILINDNIDCDVVEISEFTKEQFADIVLSNIVDMLEEDKQIELSGKQPKNLNSKMRHFTFVDTYYKAIKLMTEAESGQYVKAICEYMFDGTERKLKPPIDAYFALAKRKLGLSRTRKKIGSVGGKQERIKMTEEQIEKCTNSAYSGISFKEFMRLHPNVQNDLYASNKQLLDKVDWAFLDMGIDRHPEYKICNSLYRLLTHYKEIVREI